MKSKAKAATVAEKARMARLKEMACVACMTDGGQQINETEVHHLLSANKRRGHTYTIPLCGWHHRGAHPNLPWNMVACMTDTWGASLALSSKAFHARFGTDDELLERTNKLLEKHDASGN